MQPSRALIAADFGSSCFKLVYRSATGQMRAVLMPPEFGVINAAQIDQQLESYRDDPQRSAYLTVGDEIYAAGEFARDSLVVQYHEYSKWENLSLKIFMILGLIKELTALPNSFSATLGLLLPRAEATTTDRNERIEKIKQMAATGFHFRDDAEPIRCDLDLVLFTEGAGVYLNHAMALRTKGQFAQQIDVPIVMGGERNTSLTYFERGKLNPKRSDSNGPHFYEVAELMRKNMGVDVPLHMLIAAVARRQPAFRYPGLSKPIDISAATEAALDDYCQRMKTYLIARLPVENVSVCGCGGALWLIWNRLQDWFDNELNIPATYLSASLESDLKAVLAGDTNFNLMRNPADPIRFADAYGVYQVLLSQSRMRSPSTQLVA